jgi:hypothetical protein
LEHIEGDAPDAGGKGLVFETAGVTQTGLGTLVGFSAQGAGAFAKHGLIDEEANALGEAIGTLFGEQLHDVVQEVRVFRMGHE